MTVATLTREPGRAYLLDIIRDARHRTAAAAPQVASWLHWLQAVKQLAPASLYAYEKRVTPLLRMFPDVPLEDFTEDHLIAVLSRTKDGSKHPVTTAFVSLFRSWAYNRDLIPKDPTRLLNERRGGKRQTYKETFTDPEVDSLVRLPGEHGFRMMLMLYTGLRISELCNLQVKDVHVDIGPHGPVGRVVVLKGKGNKDREVPMPQKLVYAFLDWERMEVPERSDFLFGHLKPGGHEGTLHRKLPLSHDGLRQWFYRQLVEAGVRKLRPHTTRHTFATRLIRNGAPMHDVQKFLGHSSIETTIGTYTHLVTDDTRASIELVV